MIAADARYVRPDGSVTGPLALRVGAGERVLVSGPSGSGKSTLLGLLSGALARHGRGRVEGAARLGDVDPGALPPAERPKRIGFVPQDPGDALVAGTVADEVAFGPRCARLPDVEERVRAALARAGAAVDGGRDPRALSTGERQRVVVAGALAAGARVLLLDEPLAHLDPAGARALLVELGRLADEGVAVVVAEHRVRTVLPWCTRHVSLRDGRVVDDGLPGAAPPEPTAVPLPDPAGPEVLVEPELSWPGLFRGRSLSLRAGERVAVVGPNGVGKSTLLGLLSGRLSGRPRQGRLEVPADPDLTLFCDTVRAELAYGPTERGADRAAVAEVVARVAAALRLGPVLDRPPHATSRGERLRVAVGAAIAAGPRVLLLDEPTAGQDEEAVEALFLGLRALLPDGAVVFATHDPGVARRHAHRVVELP